ncbi:helix-turn-helix transcriptional regulator [Nocardia colli]|uniref:helix-turn-helix transcriptional regulator n=1 Tax=Nocardia colli TaxID=2545717 RepID=UPI0035E33819
MLYGRMGEERQISTLLAAAREGRSAALALVAEPGAGKTALLDRAAELVDPNWQVLRCAGVEAESEFLFAGLQSLLASALGARGASIIDALPEPQRDALCSAIGLTSAAYPADPYVVGLATLSLLAELSAQGPVLCLVDDFQWLDQASVEALRFAARRLDAEGVVVLFAGRTESAAAGVPQLRPAPLDPAAAGALLADRWPALSIESRERILAEACGNPLALLELPTMDLDSLPVGPLRLPDRLESGYRRQVAEQSAAARTAMLVVAAEESGALGLVLSVLADLGLPATALAEPERSGLVLVADRSVSFRHPLQRAAAYHSASFTERLAVHAAIAAALADDPDRRAWHLAAATPGLDETVAAALESVAERARERAGYAAASTAVERAARLSADRSARMRRLVLAAEWAAEAGRSDRALRLAHEAEQLPLAPLERARLGAARALIEFEYGSLRKARDLLMVAAQDAAATEPTRAATMLVDASRASWTMGELSEVQSSREKLAELVARDAQLAPMLAALDGVIGLCSGELEATIVSIRETVTHSRHIPAELPSLKLAFAAQAMLIGDVVNGRDILTDLVADLRDRGMLGWFSAASASLGTSELMLGRLREADTASNQALRIATDIGQPSRMAHAEANLALIAAIRGDEQRCRELAERNLRGSPGDYNFIDVTHCEWALAVLDLGYGRNESALDRLEAHYQIPNRVRGHWIHLLRDLVEAAARLRRPDRAARAMAEIEHWSAALRVPFAEAIALRGRAMLHGDESAYVTAMKLQAGAGLWYDHARTGLVYGEFLRRERRLGEARTQLRKAMETFDRLGAEPWAHRARAELRAAGEGALPETAATLTATLTPQELQVVRLAAAGATNREIGARVFLSPKTVAHHLYRAFPKLGIASRVELARLDLD